MHFLECPSCGKRLFFIFLILDHGWIALRPITRGTLLESLKSFGKKVKSPAALHERQQWKATKCTSHFCSRMAALQTSKSGPPLVSVTKVLSWHWSGFGVLIVFVGVLVGNGVVSWEINWKSSPPYAPLRIVFISCKILEK